MADPVITDMAVRQRWRTGRKLGRTIYEQLGADPSGDDTLIGVMDSPGLAAAACHAHNALLDFPAVKRGHWTLAGDSGG